jgi:hypothetical protein
LERLDERKQVPVHRKENTESHKQELGLLEQEHRQDELLELYWPEHHTVKEQEQKRQEQNMSWEQSKSPDLNMWMNKVLKNSYCLMRRDCIVR